MQVIVKIILEQSQDTEKIIRESIVPTLPRRLLEEVIIAPVFPGLTQGHRARLYQVDLPGELSAQDVEKIVETLRRNAAFEYAEVPAVKHLMSRTVQ